MSDMIRKDFYIYLPVYLQNELEAKLNEFSNEEWFAAAWEQYRTHVLSTPKMHMQTPNLFFSQFVKKEEPAVAQIISEEPKELVEGFGEMLYPKENAEEVAEETDISEVEELKTELNELEIPEEVSTDDIPVVTVEENLPSDEETEEGTLHEFQEEKEEEIENEELNEENLEQVEEDI